MLKFEGILETMRAGVTMQDLETIPGPVEVGFEFADEPEFIPVIAYG